MQATTTTTPGGQSEYSTSSGEEEIVMTTTSTEIIGSTPVRDLRIRPAAAPVMTRSLSAEIGEVFRGQKTFVGSPMMAEEEKEDL